MGFRAHVGVWNRFVIRLNLFRYFAPNQYHPSALTKQRTIQFSVAQGIPRTSVCQETVRDYNTKFIAERSPMISSYS